MSLMSLGIKINALQKGIKEGRFTTKEQVKAAATELNVMATAGYENLGSDEKEAWYEQLAVNLFENHNNCIPCFVDIGFGRELIASSAAWTNYTVPHKQHWKFVVTRDIFPDWQFNAIVCTYCKKEALLIVKKFFEDFGGIGFKYEEPSPKTEHKVPWVEISAKKTGTYRDFIKLTNGADYDKGRIR